jgi:hypothetical protein
MNVILSQIISVNLLEQGFAFLAACSAQSTFLNYFQEEIEVIYKEWQIIVCKEEVKINTLIHGINTKKMES